MWHPDVALSVDYKNVVVAGDLRHLVYTVLIRPGWLSSRQYPCTLLARVRLSTISSQWLNIDIKLYDSFRHYMHMVAVVLISHVIMNSIATFLIQPQDHRSRSVYIFHRWLDYLSDAVIHPDPQHSNLRSANKAITAQDSDRGRNIEPDGCTTVQRIYK